MLDGVTGEPRQPVIGMDRVGRLVTRPRPAVRRSGHPLDHRFGELLHVLLKRLLGDSRGRAGGDVVHGETGLDGDHVGKLGGPAPGVHVAGHSPRASADDSSRT